DVGYRATAGRGVAADAVVVGVAVDQAAHGLAHHVIDARLAAGTYSDEVLLGYRRRSGYSCIAKGGGEDIGECSEFHGIVSFFLVPPARLVGAGIALSAELVHRRQV